MALFTGAFLWNLLGVITAFIALTIIYFKWEFQYWKKRNVPYLEPSIPFGNFPSPLKSVSLLGTEVPKMYQEAKSKGWKYVGIYSMIKPLFMVVDLDVLKFILTKDFNNFVDRGFYSNEKDDPISAHLFALGGQKWKNLRSKMSPTFTSGKLKAMFQTVVDSEVLLEKYINKCADKKEAIDMKEILVRFAIHIITSCAFGLDVNSFEDPDSPLRKYSRRFLAPSGLESLLNIFGQSFPVLAQKLGVRAVPKDVSDFFTKLVKETVNYREQTKSNRKDFLQQLIDLKENDDPSQRGIKGDNTITMNELVAQCFVFFFAGFETTSTSMSFALFEVATHPEIQEKLTDEIRTVLAKHDGQVTYDSLSELKYMEQVINETLRKYPPVPFITRVAAADYRLPGEDVIIEKGTQILIPIKAIQHDEEYYPNPTAFDPDRFSEANKQRRHQYTQMPFGGGPRACIGERFAIMEIKVGLTSLLRSYRITLNKQTEVPLRMSTNMLVPNVEGGIWIDIEKV